MSTFALIALFLGCSNQEPPTLSTIIGTIDSKINDTLWVNDVVQNPTNRDMIIITDGKFKYSTISKGSDIRTAANRDQSILFNFLTYPGKSKVVFENGQLNIEGDLNKKLNEYYHVSMNLMRQKQRTLFTVQDSTDNGDRAT